MTEDKLRRNEIERHFQTVALALIIAVMMWVGGTMRSMYDAQIEQRVSMEQMRLEMQAMQKQLAQLPTAREIDARFEATHRRLEIVERRP